MVVCLSVCALTTWQKIDLVMDLMNGCILLLTLYIALPRFVSKPGNITVDVGAPVQVAVSCEATGSPRPVISWLGPNNILLNVTGSNLTLDGTSFSTSFAGKYICVATNSVGQSTTEFYVFVQGIFTCIHA